MVSPLAESRVLNAAQEPAVLGILQAVDESGAVKVEYGIRKSVIRFGRCVAEWHK